MNNEGKKSEGVFHDDDCSDGGLNANNNYLKRKEEFEGRKRVDLERANKMKKGGRQKVQRCGKKCKDTHLLPLKEVQRHPFVII